MHGQIWEVVGGLKSGGVLVRMGERLDSWEAPDGGRLAHGAIVMEKQLRGDRLKYRKVSGEGPLIGWVSVTCKNADILVRRDPVVEGQKLSQERTVDKLEFESRTGSVTLSEDGYNWRVKIMAHGPKGGGLVDWALVFCAGNPSDRFNSDHAGSPLGLAVEQACCAAGVGCARFDYRGVGVNSTGGAGDPKDWTMPTMEQSERDALAVVAWTKKNLSRNIVISGCSYGASVALSVSLYQRVLAYVGFSTAPLVWKFAEPGDAQQFAKLDAQRHKDVDCPALFICGTKDSLTPPVEVRQLVGLRRDRGSQVTISEVHGGNHLLEGVEDVAAAACTAWIKEL